MDIEGIIESGFIKAFFTEYYEYKTHSFYPDKDRLLYALCDSETEKHKITTEQIEKTKLKIKNLGFEEMSYAYLLSYKESSVVNYIEPNERHSFWLERFLIEYKENVYSFKPIQEAVLSYYNTNEIDESCFENTDDFWNFYSKNEHPKNSSLRTILEREKELQYEIELIIEEYKQNEWWEIDFEELEKSIPFSKPIEQLFAISELFVQLNRLEMFKSFLEIKKAPKEKNEASVLEMKDALGIKGKMEHQIKEDLIINNQNIFGLEQDINLSISSIQYEILSQLKSNTIDSISDYLGGEIDITKEIPLTQSLTIQKVFSEFLDFENINPLEQNILKCSFILPYLQISLLKEYYKENQKSILTFSRYKSDYNSLRNSYLSSNIDTDEQDFIKAELTLCENIIIELKKSIYNIINPLGDDVLDEPCDFKKNLINSINKRKKFLIQKENETFPKVKALFNFIEFLHLNIENFTEYNKIINELKLLDKERNKVNPRKNYQDKLKYDEVQKSIQEKFKIIRKNIIEPIHKKANELNICDLNETKTLWNWNISEISSLKENFSQKDLPEILKHKRKYLEYRTETNGENYFELQFFFNDLDEILKLLFNYFKETDQNEFEAFETKTIEVNSINEAVKEFTKEKSELVKLKITGLNFEIKESDTFKNMPVINKHYLPLIDGLKTKINNNEIPTNEIKSYWQTLRTQIESDLYDTDKFYNDETIEFCKKRIFPLIDIEIKKAQQIISSQQTTKPNQSKEIELSKKKIESQKTKGDKLLENIEPYGFNKLEKVFVKNIFEILQMIATSKLPFQIAYLDFLGFIAHLDSNFCQSNKELHMLLAKILNTNERAVRGNINVLRNEKSTDKNRYTSYKHTENVKKHYDSIK